jgi:hypothetical protein
VVAGSSTRRRARLMQNPVSCDLDGSVDACVHGMLVPPLPAEKRLAVVLSLVRFR